MKAASFCICFAVCTAVNAQQDTIHIPEVVITSYFSDRPLLRTPASVGVLDSSQLENHPGQSLLPALNSLAGVRMEERSPGSYRLSIRGSLLRSPFGVRNVKVYADEFPLTDAGGNTYINLIDPSAIQRIEVLKGPDGSLFGANSGGVVRLNLTGDTLPRMHAGFSAGSFGLFRAQISAVLNIRKHRLTIADGWQRSDGYRANSAFRRQYIHIADDWRYAEGFRLQILFVSSALAYRTPGGLTLEQFNADPTDARPATTVLPGAEEQKTGVFNETYFGGIHHTAKIMNPLVHHVVVFGSLTDFKNPFITNYETRKEKSGGLRTWMQAGNNNEDPLQWKAWLGFEGQRTDAEIANYDNKKGIQDTLRVADEMAALQYFIFSRVTIDYRSQLIVEAAVSLNYAAYIFEAVYPVPTQAMRRNFAPQWMPRFSASWLFAPNMALRISVAKGYSAPTLAEIRSSDNVINTSLQPEAGWNYETGIRMTDQRGIAWWDFSVFYYRLDHAIVRRLNESGEEYFVNSGGTIQPGVESQLVVHLFRNRKNGVTRGIILSSSYTFNSFRFESYRVDTNDYGGNRVTGVPEHVLVTSAEILFPAGFSFFAQDIFTSRIPLNDANSVYADSYYLVQAKIKWKYNAERFALVVFAGADNLLNEKYSLGHDLNAAGKRYYNAAPLRNYYGGIGITF